MLFSRKKQATRTRVGCGYILSQGVILCLLLVINGFIVRSTINLDWGEEVRITQGIQLILPIAMIFIGLWVFDLIFASTTRHKN